MGRGGTTFLAERVGGAPRNSDHRPTMASTIFYINIGETAMADNALQHARELYDLADFHRGTYTDHIPAANFYA
jgi:hypothetical protein